jgi:hypothetical protein
MAINAKQNLASFFNQFNPLLPHCNHLLHHHFNHLPKQLNDSFIRSSTHLFSMPPTMGLLSVNFYYFFIIININYFCHLEIVQQCLKHILYIWFLMLERGRGRECICLRANGQEIVIQRYRISAHFKDIMPSHFLAISSTVFFRN